MQGPSFSHKKNVDGSIENMDVTYSQIPSYYMTLTLVCICLHRLTSGVL